MTKLEKGKLYILPKDAPGGGDGWFPHIVFIGEKKSFFPLSSESSCVILLESTPVMQSNGVNYYKILYEDKFGYIASIYLETLFVKVQ